MGIPAQCLERLFTLLSLCLIAFSSLGMGPSFVNLQSPNGIRWLTYESTYLNLLDASKLEGRNLRIEIENLLESGFCEPPLSTIRTRNRACSLIQGSTILLITSPWSQNSSEKKYHVSALAEALRPDWQSLQKRCFEALPSATCNRLNVEFEADGRPRCGFTFESKSGSKVLFLGGYSKSDLETCQ